MNVYYDLRQKQWGHREPEKALVWGKQNLELPRMPFSPDTVPNAIHASGNKIGPLIGILTNSKGTTFAGNRKTFQRIQSALQEKGGILFIFSPDNIKNGRIYGYYLYSKMNQWNRALFPYPDVVYNRIPSRKNEETLEVRKLIEQFQQLNIPFFNSRFFNKWETYQWLGEDDFLRQHLPKTEILNAQNDLDDALFRGNEIYLKPADGRKGDGIFTLSPGTDGKILFRSNKRVVQYDDLSQLWANLNEFTANKRYIIQQKVDLDQYDDRPYDFRLLIQKIFGEWSLTGLGARLAKRDGITTHVPKGGELLELEHIKPPPDTAFLTELSKKTAFTLERQCPSLSEFSLDVGRDQNGHYWIFEANAKPMKFDEEEIEKKRMARLIDIFYEKSGFK
jgi:glutathione synthase/RimK-type ligase-like ATP-grasp enzyme